MDSLVDVHGNALTDEMKYSCLDYNARVVDLNNQHEAATAASSAKREDEEVQAKSRSWTHAEDALVRDLVKQHGPKKWAVIAERLGKDSKASLRALRDYLQPGLTTRAWEPFEEEHLIQIQEVIGNQWAVLARLMPGRSPNAIKNKFHATRRKFERKGDHFDDDGDARARQTPSTGSIPSISPTASESTPCRTHTYVLYVPYESALAPSLVHRSPFPTVFDARAAAGSRPRSSIPATMRAITALVDVSRIASSCDSPRRRRSRSSSALRVRRIGRARFATLTGGDDSRDRMDRRTGATRDILRED